MNKLPYSSKLHIEIGYICNFVLVDWKDLSLLVQVSYVAILHPKEKRQHEARRVT